MRTVEEIQEAAGAGTAVTRAEAERLVRAVTRTCRGLPVLDQATRDALHGAFQSALGRGDWNAMVAATEDAEKAIGIDSTRIPKISRDEEMAFERLYVRAAAAIFAHGDTVGNPCGADFNDIILAGELDGKQHDYICPKCGQAGQYGAPLFVIEDTA